MPASLEKAFIIIALHGMGTYSTTTLRCCEYTWLAAALESEHVL